MLLKSRSLWLVNWHIFRHHIFSLHSFLPWEATNHYCNVNPGAGLHNISCSNNTYCKYFGSDLVIVQLIPHNPTCCTIKKSFFDNLSGHFEKGHEGQIPLRRGNAASTNSIFTPFNASAAGGISSMWRITGWSGPSITPLAIMGTRAYPICPANPTTHSLCYIAVYKSHSYTRTFKNWYQQNEN